MLETNWHLQAHTHHPVTADPFLVNILICFIIIHFFLNLRVTADMSTSLHIPTVPSEPWLANPCLSIAWRLPCFVRQHPQARQHCRGSTDEIEKGET